jgi:hypothetical protein
MSAPLLFTPTSHPDPHTLVEHYDNLTLLLAHMESLFQLMSFALEGRVDSASVVASFGEDLSKEAQKRAEALYKFAARKEG